MSTNISWFVAYYTPSRPRKSMLSRHNTSKAPTEVHFIEKSVFMQGKKFQKNGSFKLGVEKEGSVSVFIEGGLQLTDRIKSQKLPIYIFLRPLVITAKCLIGTEKHSEVGLRSN